MDMTTSTTDWVLPSTQSHKLYVIDELREVTTTDALGETNENDNDKDSDDDDEESGYQSFPFLTTPPEEQDYSALQSVLAAATSTAEEYVHEPLAKRLSSLQTRLLSKLQTLQENWKERVCNSQLWQRLADEATCTAMQVKQQSSPNNNNSNTEIPPRSVPENAPGVPHQSTPCGRTKITSSGIRSSGMHSLCNKTTRTTKEQGHHRTVLVELARLPTTSSTSEDASSSSTTRSISRGDSLNEEEGYECVITRADYLMCAEVKHDAGAAGDAAQRKLRKQNVENIPPRILLQRV